MNPHQLLSVDPSSISTGIAAVKSGFEVAKGIRELLKQEKVDAHEISAQLLRLQELMLDSQRALNEADAELKTLQSQLDRRKELDADKLWEPDGSFYLRKSDREAGRFIPYCPICWDATQNSIPMAPLNVPGAYKCGLHEPRYYTKEHDHYIQERDRRAAAIRAQRFAGNSNSWMG